MFEIFKGLNYEEANSVAYYTLKALNNIDVDELMKINNDGDIKISNLSKKLARCILNKSRNSLDDVNYYIEEMNSILDCKPVTARDIPTCISAAKVHRYGKVSYSYRRKNGLFRKSPLRTYK